MKPSSYIFFLAFICFHFSFAANGGTLSEALTRQKIDNDNSDINKYNYKATPDGPYSSFPDGGVGSKNNQSSEPLNANPIARCLTKRGSCIVENQARAYYLEGTRCYCRFNSADEELLGTVIIIK